MSIVIDEPAVHRALERISLMLDADGFELRLRLEAGHLKAAVVATDATCAECLVPKELLESMILEKLDVAGIHAGPDDLILTYPTR